MNLEQLPDRGPHASADELAQFVIDTLEPGARRHLERHVAACTDCARALAAEAAAEMALLQAWSSVPRPLAPVLNLPVRPPAPAVAPARARRHVLAGNSWTNGAAAAMLTVLFVGYWHEGRRPAAHSHFIDAADGTAFDQALCPLDVFTPAPLFASVEPAGHARMCTAPDVDVQVDVQVDDRRDLLDSPGGLCQEPTATCR
jgi:anti-sigma factor RsiW